MPWTQRTSLAAALLLLGCKGRGTPVPSDPPAPGECTVESTPERAHYQCPFEWRWNDTAGVAVGPEFVFEMPDDLIAFASFVEQDGADVGFARVVVDDEVWTDAEELEAVFPAWDQPPHFHFAALGGGWTSPIDVTSDPSGATELTVSAAKLENADGAGILHVVVRRGTSADEGVLDLNIGIVGGAQFSEAEETEMVEAIDRVFGGVRIGAVERFAVDGDTLVRDADVEELRRNRLGTNDTAINVFIIQDYRSQDGTLGEAGGIPGPLGVQGVDGAGVVVAIDAHADGAGVLDADLLGQTLAHEIGHQVGLFHTTEDDGTRTEALDTPECPPGADTNGDGSYSAEECADADGSNFMFWSSGNLVQETVSPDQRFVLSRAPVVSEVDP